MTPAVTLLKKQKQTFELHEYAHDPAAGSYGLEAAEKLGLDARRVLKTLVAQADTGELLVAMIPVCNSLSLKRLAVAAGVKKVAMASPALVSRSTGYVLGGVSPLGQKRRLRTFVDQSAAGFASLYVSGGRRGLEIELAPAAFRQLLNADFVSLVVVK